MLAINGLDYTNVSSVPLGHLILCGSYGVDPAPSALGIRVEVPAENSTDRDGVLLLRSVSHWGHVGAVVYGKCGDQMCLNLGLPAFAISDDSIYAAMPKRPYDPRPGMLALCGRDLFIFTAFGMYGHQLAWWHVATGKQRNCEERLVLERWCVGLVDLDRKFIPQLRYPEDFKRNAPDVPKS